MSLVENCRVSLPIRRAVAEQVLGSVEWVSDVEGNCVCPAAETHTHPGKDCKIYLDKVPTIFCFHQSCLTEVEHQNQRLRAAIAARESGSKHSMGSKLEKPPGMKTEARDHGPENEERQSGNKLFHFAKANLPLIFGTHPMNPDHWYAISPIHLPEYHENEDWRALLNVLPPSHSVWIGELNQSGSPEHMNRFREVSSWLNEKVCPGPFICPANFKPGTFSRAEDQVQETSFIIVESDTLSKEEMSSVFLWLKESWHLVAIVDTGNKSLHGWFQRPILMSQEVWNKNKEVLKGFGCDVSMLRPAQACRLPGFLRPDNVKWQHLRYLDTMEFGF